MSAFDRLCQFRWPDGVRCPQCDGEAVYRLESRQRLTCANPACRKQFSPTTGTVFKYRKMPPEKYVLALEMYPHCANATALQRALQVEYKTAHSIWRALKATNGRLA